MLKRLELVGFKSFADKTQFDFSAGITAIVGPNGSGKSNIVDAVRWILGEQSAKSLRGGEMADVIFNGSSSRRSLGLAEVTMTFDNSKRALATDAEEVQITRRVYRSSEGEYLINGQACRLKDIKELFLGSGAGTDAYCIIAQGRVDALLQSSNQDRRTIFEEAAGISRFKAKKIETLRKLERVDQNLARLRDIIGEVEKQLRSVKLQASKAQKYQEYSQRLQLLRVGLGLQEYQQVTGQLTIEQSAFDELRARLTAHAERFQTDEEELRQLEMTLQELDILDRQHETALTTARQQIATEETTLAREQELSGEQAADLARNRIRLTELTGRVAELAATAAAAAGELREAEGLFTAQDLTVRELEDAARSARLRMDELKQQIEADRLGHQEQHRLAAHLHNEVVMLKAQLDALARDRERLRTRSEQAAVEMASLDQELQQVSQADEALQARLTDARQTLAEFRHQRDRQQHQLEVTNQLIADLRGLRSGLGNRIDVLEGLERSQEGLGSGVREVVALLAQPDAGPWATVRGMVADVLTVEREYAPLIDLALGDQAQRFLVADESRLAAALSQRPQPFSSRVGFLPLGRVNGMTADGPSSDGPGTVGADGLPAVQVVRCDVQGLKHVPALLLGSTRIVRDLAAARALAARAPGLRLVTLQGELLEPDGSLTVGIHHAEAGILSRKSELRELREQAANMDALIADEERAATDRGDGLAELDRRIANQQMEVDVLAEQAADLRLRLSQYRQRREGLHEDLQVSRQEIHGLEREIARQDEALRLARQQAETAEQQVQALEARLEQAEREIRLHEHERHQQEQATTAAKVARAQTEERLSGLRARHRQLDADWQQRRQELDQAGHQVAAAQGRLRESERTMLRASATLAQVYLDKEAAEASRADLASRRADHRRQRQQLADRTQGARSEWQALQEQAHERELAASNLRHQRDTLTGRLREDYQIELRAQAADQLPEPVGPDGQVIAVEPIAEASRPEAEEEIADLRRKLSRLGSVNLESLQELAELETRASNLQAQFDDLAAAQKALQDIIQTINTDSRRLFVEIFTAIRGHFQELFRKLFGGGMADIVLEDENEVLDSGIEIIARPPGKELRSISLMSGGEKTMTAVALLLAIFRSKPSPFCLLDEVDAALDEANIARYCAVVRDFCDTSQFIIITHSKKTMAAADVIYGITMQESGISKRVAIRFEDWEDDTEASTDEAGQLAG